VDHPEKYIIRVRCLQSKTVPEPLGSARATPNRQPADQHVPGGGRSARCPVRNAPTPLTQARHRPSHEPSPPMDHAHGAIPHERSHRVKRAATTLTRAANISKNWQTSSMLPNHWNTTSQLEPPPSGNPIINFFTHYVLSRSPSMTNSVEPMQSASIGTISQARAHALVR
jgi:hypothetical protein